MSSRYTPVRKLVLSDDLEFFDCGQAALNQFLQRFALTNHQSHGAQIYACCQGASVVGYYSLAVGSVEPVHAVARVVKGMPQHPISVMILARLAVDLRCQGVGLGSALLRDALWRTANAADIAGIRALLVHAKDDCARKWYSRWEFEPSATDPLHLFLLMKDLKALLGA